MSGGEPTLLPGLLQLCEELKKGGLLIKIDTNGTNSGVLKTLIDCRLVDYIAVDVKQCLEKYHEAIGLNKKKLPKILREITKTIALLKKSSLEYEFRTTVVPGIHSEEDILRIAQLIEGASRYYLQQFRPGKTVSKKYENCHPIPIETLYAWSEKIKSYVSFCEVRVA
ncbi:radical SAM protein [Chlamydiota bacterium]